MARELLHAGAFDYLRKPIDLDYLWLAVGAAAGHPWQASAYRDAPLKQRVAVPALTRRAYAVAALSRRLTGPDAERERLETLAQHALRLVLVGQPRPALTRLAELQGLFTSGALAWLAPDDAATLWTEIEALPRYLLQLGESSAPPPDLAPLEVTRTPEGLRWLTKSLTEAILAQPQSRTSVDAGRRLYDPDATRVEMTTPPAQLFGAMARETSSRLLSLFRKLTARKNVRFPRSTRSGTPPVATTLPGVRKTASASGGSSSVRHLYIVHRDRPELYDALRRTFEDSATVMVLLDRRFIDRRRVDVPPRSESRRSQRRQILTTDLATRGWVMIRGEALPATEAPAR